MKETVSSVGELYLKMVEVAGGNPVLFLFLYAKTTFYIMEKSDHEKLFEEVIL